MELLGYVITGVFSVVAVIITNMLGNSKIQNEMKINQAITDTKLENLTDEVRQHNNFAQRVPVLQDRVERLEKQIERLETQKLQ